MRARAAVPQLGCSIGAATLISIPMLVSADPTLTAALSHIASSAVACALVAVAGATYLAQRDIAPPAALAPALLASFVASSLVYALRLDVTTSIAGDALGWVSRLVAWMSLAALGPLWVFPAGGGAEGLRASRLAFMEMVGLLVLFTLGVAAHVCMAGAVAEGTLDQSGRLGFVVAAFALAMSWPCLSRLLSRMRLAPGAPQDGAQCDAEAWGQAHAIERLDGAERLTGRERSVLGLLSEGRAQAQVAAQLGISPSTVSTYRARALRKLGLPADCDLRHLGTKDAAPVVHPAVRVSRVAPLGGFLLPLACVLLGALLEGLSLSQGWDADHVGVRLALSWVVMLWLAVRLWVPTELSLDTMMGTRALAVASACCLGLLLGPTAATEQGVSLFGFLQLNLSTSNFLLLLLCCAVLLAVAHSLLSRGPSCDIPMGPQGEEACLHYLIGRGLNELQAKVALELARGQSRRDIGQRLHVALGTVSSYSFGAYRRLGVHSRAELARLLSRDVGYKGDGRTA